MREFRLRTSLKFLNIGHFDYYLNTIHHFLHFVMLGCRNAKLFKSKNQAGRMFVTDLCLVLQYKQVFPHSSGNMSEVVCVVQFIKHNQSDLWLTKVTVAGDQRGSRGAEMYSNKLEII